MSAARPCEAITAQSNETLTLVRHSRIENHMARVPVTTLYKALMHRQWSRRVVCVSVLLLLLSFVYNVAANDADYTQPGPCYFDENVYCEGGCASLKVKTTIPRNSGEGGCLAAPHPVVVFFDGYQVPMTANKDYREKLASHGYVVVEYDLTPLRPIPDEIELPVMYQILDRLRQMAADGPQSSYSKIDFNWISVSGYSRGAKLAALHLARNTTLRTAYMVDPVDSTFFTPDYFLQPDGPAELAKLNPRPRAGIAGSGITAMCNPSGAVWDTFFKSLGSGSWLQVFPQGGHLALARVPLRYVGNTFCGTHSEVSDNDAIAIASATCLAWFEHIRTGQEPPPSFLAWKQKVIASGVATFEVKQ